MTFHMYRRISSTLTTPPGAATNNYTAGPRIPSCLSFLRADFKSYRVQAACRRVTSAERVERLHSGAGAQVIRRSRAGAEFQGRTEGLFCW